MKICTLCLEEKPLTEFSRRSGKQSHLYQSRCKPCRSKLNSKKNKERYHSDPAIKDRIDKYRQDNPDKVKEWRRKEYENHREDYIRRAREWREENRSERRQISRRYKVKRKEWELNGSFTTEEWNLLLDTCGHRCLSCDRVDLPLTQDHVIPLSLGGSNTIDNIQPLCGPCNSSKGVKTIDYRKG